MVVADPCPSVHPPPLFLSSPSPPISSVQPVSSAPDTDHLSPNSTATSPSPVIVPQAPPNDRHLPIALRKGTHTCTQHPIYHFVFYDRLSPSFRAFALLVASESILRSHVEAAQVREWKAAMDHEVEALVSRGTWTLVPRPADANIVTCKWVFIIKYHPDGTIARHKARLVARGFTQAYDIDYTETFSPVVRLNSVRVLLSLAINQAWSLHQLDVSNAFLYGDLEEQVFMKKPPGYVAQGESSKVCFLRRAIYRLKQSPRAWLAKFSGLLSTFGFTSCAANPTVLTKKTKGGLVILAVYVDDIILTRSDDTGILATKTYLQQHLSICDLGSPRYFLGIEFAHQDRKLALTQRKYALDMLEETGLLGCKPETSPMEARPQFWDTSSPLFEDANRYQRLLGKLIYLTITRPDIV